MHHANAWDVRWKAILQCLLRTIPFFFSKGINFWQALATFHANGSKLTSPSRTFLASLPAADESFGMSEYFLISTLHTGSGDEAPKPWWFDTHRTRCMFINSNYFSWVMTGYRLWIRFSGMEFFLRSVWNAESDAFNAQLLTDLKAGFKAYVNESSDQEVVEYVYLGVALAS